MSTKSKEILDFRLLPRVEFRHIVSRLSREIDRRMDATGLFMETLDRARSAVVKFYSTDGSAETWLNEGYIRAGLSEFSSIPKALGRDLSDGRYHRIIDFQNPLFHLMIILRDINIHARRSKTGDMKKKVFIAGEMEFTYPIVILKDLTVKQLLTKREVRQQYRHDDLKKIVDWFNCHQRIFGADFLFVVGVELYCCELLSKYCGQKLIQNSVSQIAAGGPIVTALPLTGPTILRELR